MSLYTLLSNATVPGLPLPPSPVVRPVPINQQGSLPVITGNLMDPNLNIGISDSQAFQVVVTGAGAVSASVQIYGSNDNKNWARIGNPITATGTTTATAGANGTVGYSFFGALLTAISGTNASCTTTMNA